MIQSSWRNNLLVSSTSPTVAIRGGQGSSKRAYGTANVAPSSFRLWENVDIQISSRVLIGQPPKGYVVSMPCPRRGKVYRFHGFEQVRRARVIDEVVRYSCKSVLWYSKDIFFSFGSGSSVMNVLSVLPLVFPKRYSVVDPQISTGWKRSKVCLKCRLLCISSSHTN